MNKITAFFALVVFIPLSFVHTLAQGGNELSITEEAVSKESTNIDVIISHDVQDPGTKEFHAIADITSIIDSDRVVVEWQLGSGMKLADEEDSLLSRTTLEIGKTSRVQKRLLPTTSGIKELKAVVTAIKADVNYVTTDKISIEFNENKEIIPLSEEYKNAKLTYQIIKALTYLVVIFGVSIIAYLVYLQIKKIRE